VEAMRGLCFLILTMTLISGEVKAASPASLADFRWRYRLLLVIEPAASTTAIGSLRSASAAIDDRDVIWLVIGRDTVASNWGQTMNPALIDEIYGRFGRQTSVVLIGKDGGVKSRSSRLQLSETLSLIDTMPMRRREMREPD
jgi:hypothetical protein